MTESTPGPWGVERTATTNWIGPLRKDGKVNHIIASTKRDKALKPEVRANNDANAELISAAPELLEALRDLHDFAVTDSHYRHGDRSFQRAAVLLNRLNG